MNLFGKYPAIVRSWDRTKRECRVEIPGITDGADILPLAELAYPLGDKSEHTEIRITVGDRVWVEFERGDARSPIITHFRTKRTGNMALRRQWHHESIQWDADDEVVINAGIEVTIHVGGSTIVVDGSSVTVTTDAMTIDAPQTTITGNLAVEGGMSVTGGAGASMTITGSIMNNGKVIDSTHTHPDITSGGNTGPVN